MERGGAAINQAPQDKHTHFYWPEGSGERARAEGRRGGGAPWNVSTVSDEVYSPDVGS